VIAVDPQSLVGCAGIGVAGNFAGHLEQAGEAADFVAVDSGGSAPKGIFPWYLPGDSGFLGAFPLSSDALILPASEEPLNLQIEPEAGVIFDVEYEGGQVASVWPRILAAFNDCSIRRPGAKKISEKKNWGACSKGIAARGFEITELDRDGETAKLRLACFLRRGEQCFEYGVDSPLPGYSYYGQTLIDWIVERLCEQRGGDTPLEDVGRQLAGCASPERIVVGIGATRYTDFGESNFLEVGDESVVVVYDSDVNAPDEVFTAVRIGDEGKLDEASVLVQTVI
jgi:hypothetical protein